MPNFVDRIPQGTGSRGAVGAYIAESLPNIIGEMYSGGIITTYNVSGVFYGSRNGGGNGGTHNSVINSQTQYTVFNARNSSSVYKDKAPVQQDATVVNFCIRY